MDQAKTVPLGLHALRQARWRAPPPPDETIEITIVKHNAALDGFNQWTLNGEAFSMEAMKPITRVHRGRRYRLKFRNASDDIHPLHLHRHSFELVRVGGKPTSGVIKDVVMLGGFQEVGIRFCRRQSGSHAVSLPPAAAHGFRIHGAVRLRMIGDGLAPSRADDRKCRRRRNHPLPSHTTKRATRWLRQ